MWFATSDGLNKFNGYNFTVYRHAYGDSTSIASNTSRCIMVDGSGKDMGGHQRRLVAVRQ